MVPWPLGPEMGMARSARPEEVLEDMLAVFWTLMLPVIKNPTFTGVPRALMTRESAMAVATGILYESDDLIAPIRPTTSNKTKPTNRVIGTMQTSGMNHFQFRLNQ